MLKKSGTIAFGYKVCTFDTYDINCWKNIPDSFLKITVLRAMENGSIKPNWHLFHLLTNYKTVKIVLI